MPNHVINTIQFKCDDNRLHEIFEAIKNDTLGVGTIDFNKMIPKNKEIKRWRNMML